MVIFEEPRDFDRAYMAFPVSLEDGVVRALDWALDRTDDEWSAVNLLVPSKRVLNETPALWDMQRRGVKVSAERHSSANRSTRGPIIVYHPSLESLCAVEGAGKVTAIAVVGASRYLRPWISAYRPQHLGGEMVQPAQPLVSDPAVWEAMTTFTRSINSSTGLAHSSGRSLVTDGLKKLRQAGHRFDSDELLAAALRLNWHGSAALDLRTLGREINQGKNKQVKYGTYRDDIVQQWEAAAQERSGEAGEPG